MRISDWSSDVCSSDLYGVSAKVGGREVQVGADRFMIRLGHDVSAFAAKASELGAMGRSPLYAAIDGKLEAVIAVADPVKRSEESRVGKECVRPCRCRGSRDNEKKKNQHKTE